MPSSVCWAEMVMAAAVAAAVNKAVAARRAAVVKRAAAANKAAAAKRAAVARIAAAARTTTTAVAAAASKLSVYRPIGPRSTVRSDGPGTKRKTRRLLPRGRSRFLLVGWALPTMYQKR